MKSRTSFFNFTVLKKDLTRYAPLWGLYTVFVLLFLLLAWDDSTAAQFVNILPELLYGMAVLNFIYAGIASLLLFSDLHKPRMSNMLHALPLRREGWFFTHVTAGMLFCLIPNGLGALICAPFMGQYLYGVLLWLAVMVMEYLIFFGIGCFSALCTGTSLGSLLIYGLINFLAPLCAWLVQTFYEPLLYGIEIDLERIARLSPVVMLSDVDFLEMTYNNMNGTTTLDKFYPETWGYLGIAAGVGLVLMALAILLYRKRHLESAGDLIACKGVGPVFLGLYTLLMASIFYLTGDMFDDSFGFVLTLVGFAVGFFTGRMLLEKRVNVFGKRSLLAFVISAAVFFGSFLLTSLDPIGITRRIPTADQVTQVSISPNSYNMRDRAATLTDPGDIDAVLAIHKYAVENRDTEGIPTNSVCILYTLENGRTMKRFYRIPTTEAAPLHRIYSRPEVVLGTADPAAFMEQVKQLDYYPYENGQLLVHMSSWRYDNVSPEDYTEPVYLVNFSGSFADNATAKALVEAIYADCRAGVLSQWDYHSEYPTVGNISLVLEHDGLTEYVDVTINSRCINTLTFLNSLEPTN